MKWKANGVFMISTDELVLQISIQKGLAKQFIEEVDSAITEAERLAQDQNNQTYTVDIKIYFGNILDAKRMISEQNEIILKSDLSQDLQSIKIAVTNIESLLVIVREQQSKIKEIERIQLARQESEKVHAQKLINDEVREDYLPLYHQTKEALKIQTESELENEDWVMLANSDLQNSKPESPVANKSFFSFSGFNKWFNT